MGGFFLFWFFLAGFPLLIFGSYASNWKSSRSSSSDSESGFSFFGLNRRVLESKTIPSLLRLLWRDGFVVPAGAADLDLPDCLDGPLRACGGIEEKQHAERVEEKHEQEPWRGRRTRTSVEGSGARGKESRVVAGGDRRNRKCPKSKAPLRSRGCLRAMHPCRTPLCTRSFSTRAGLARHVTWEMKHGLLPNNWGRPEARDPTNEPPAPGPGFDRGGYDGGYDGNNVNDLDDQPVNFSSVTFAEGTLLTL